jgi:3'-phosphoadenosine 5'-phosphosulfate sulfotransferase (PAPS reductase)/FAD synthetase
MLSIRAAKGLDSNQQTQLHNQQVQNNTQHEHTTNIKHACSKWLVISSLGSDCTTTMKLETWHNAVL